MSFKVVVSSRIPRAAEVVERLQRDPSCTVVLGPSEDPSKVLQLTDAQIDEYVRDADAYICGPRDELSRKALEAGTRLRVVSSMVIGTEYIDVQAATDLGIVVAYGAVPENSLGVAEAVVMLTAALLKDLPGKMASVRNGAWRPATVGRMVWGQTVGIVGLGAIGQAVAKRLAPWECRMLCADPYVDPKIAQDLGVELVDLDTVLRESDVVSLHVTVTEETRHMIDDESFSMMKPTAYFINTSRGAAVDEDALVRALQDGRIAGAAIDAWELEPAAPDHPLRTMPNVIPTPHCIGHSQESMDALVEAAPENILRALRGQEPLYVRNPAVLPAWRARIARLNAQ
ncbi:MAG: phosphoglycerate dehydrogenase [Chloroflexota bacterium]